MKGIILAGGSGTSITPIDFGSEQAIDACLRQANDILPIEHIDAGRHT